MIDRNGLLCDLVGRDGGRLSEFAHTPTSFLGLLRSHSGGNSLRGHALRGPIEHGRFADSASTVLVQILAGGELRLPPGLQRHLNQFYLR